jgi:chromosome partitioning protein
MAWREEWGARRPKNPAADLWLPTGGMKPEGYVVLQHGVRVDRAVGADDRWIRRIPSEYRESVLGLNEAAPSTAEDDPFCLGLVKHFHSHRSDGPRGAQTDLQTSLG